MISIENQSALRPTNPVINFPNLGSKTSKGNNYDMGKHYGKGFDDITNRVFYTVQTLLKNSKNGSEKSKLSYLNTGFIYLAEYLEIWHHAKGYELTHEDISPELIAGFKGHLLGLGLGYTSQKSFYTMVKSLLTAMHKHNYWVVDKDIYAITFPSNPYPKSNRRAKGAKPFSEHEKRQVVVALKQALTGIYAQSRTEPLTSYELTVCVLGIAMQTGINTSPLLEMATDSLSDHPLKKNRKLLTVFKRRGNATQLQNLRKSEELSLVQGVKLDVAYTIERITTLNKPLRDTLNSDHLLLFTSRRGGNSGEITSLTDAVLSLGIKTLAKHYELKDEDGKAIVINLSRIRKTFINGIYELSGENILVAASAAKHKGTETIDHYLEAPEQVKRNLGLMGEVRVKELTSDAKVTPTAHCKDPINGDKAPKNGKTCADFLACFRCKSCVITGDDLYRLYSLYWAIVRNRDSFGRKDWKRHLRNVLNIIDTEVEPAFIAQGMLSHLQAERERAKHNPHPYWINLDMLRVGQ
ncbi:hypothetical protein [Paraglaciecola sp.]|uniref:hypothetical protein n=1 Tax=Paraglaciecola sp. TaxID=1920173 RepID=UPI003EF56830